MRLVELGGGNARLIQGVLQRPKVGLVTDGQVDVGRVVVRRTTVSVGVFEGGVAGLNGLLRKRQIASRDGIQVSLGGGILQHGSLRVVGWACLDGRASIPR